MKQLIITLAILLLLPATAMAQYEEDTENGVVSLAGKEGFSIATKKEISYSNLICWFKPVPISIIMMTKG